MATTETAQPSRSNDEAALMAEQRAELALDEVLTEAGTAGETRGVARLGEPNVLVKTQHALGPHHVVMPIGINLIDGYLDVRVSLSALGD